MKTYNTLVQLRKYPTKIMMGVDFGVTGGDITVFVESKLVNGSTVVMYRTRTKSDRYLKKRRRHFIDLYSDMTDKELIEGIREMRAKGETKLPIVKWVWDNCSRGLKDSKQFVDDNL